MAIDAQEHREQRDRIQEVLRSLQRDTLPSYLRVHEDEDVSIIEIALLQTLDPGREAVVGDPTLKELAALLGRSTSRTGRLVDRMVRRGLVERYEDGADRRVRRVRLSNGGTAVLTRIVQARVDAQAELWSHLTSAELKAVATAMELLATAAHRIRSERDARGEPQ